MMHDDPPSPAEARQLGDRLYRFCLALLRQDADAREAAQEALLRAWQRRSSRRPDVSWWTWSAGFAVNVCREWRRAAGRHDTEPADEHIGLEPPHPVEALIEEERLRRLHGAVGRLPPRQREVVALRYFDGCPLEEVARILDCPVGTVKSNLHKAVQNLKSALGAGERHSERSGA